MTNYRKLVYRMPVWLGVIGASLVLILFGYAALAKERMLPRVHIGSVNVGLLTRDQASELIRARALALRRDGLVLLVGDNKETIHLDNVGSALSVEGLVARAWDIGHGDSMTRRLIARILAPFLILRVPATDMFDTGGLEMDVDAMAALVDRPRTDIRLHVANGEISILSDTQPGKIIDREKLRADIIKALSDLEVTPVRAVIREDFPRASVDSAAVALRQANAMAVAPLILVLDDRRITVSRGDIALWLASEYDGDKLLPGIDSKKLGAYIANVAAQINVAPQGPRVVFDGGRLVEFVPPNLGRTLDETNTSQLIVDELKKRREGEPASEKITLMVKETKPTAATGDLSGITELIGMATTPFTGSPANRVHNIKNGVKFLSGLIVRPGEEFSTLGSLGEIDNAAGYLPELVIKGSSTVPEFGGGLCQVSTTLFRAVLNAGLPITARKNHSYRVSYYEKDGAGRTIGPGLDATIYDPDLDFKFKNDTAQPILIYGYVKGDKITFELYGTRDGRVAEIVGPKLLSETPAGPAIYVETATLAKGVTKQVETAHPGGSATATYRVTYSDGRVAEQEFKSWYRRWPAKYLVGTR